MVKFLFVLLLCSNVWAMEYVDLCNRQGECKKVSRLVMGTDHLVQGDWVKNGQPEPSEEEAFKVLDEAVLQGINFFDTSPIYVGGVENKLGKWKKEQKNPVYILSKGGFPFDLYWAQALEHGYHSLELWRTLREQNLVDNYPTTNVEGKIKLKNVPPGTYASRLWGHEDQIVERVGEELSHTLKNLNNDVTVYLMHRDDGDAVGFKAVKRNKTPVKKIMEALSRKEISGKFFVLGWSNWETDRINESLKIAQESENLTQPVINSPYFSLFEMSERTIHALGVQVTHQEMMDPEFQKGIKIMPYSPLGGFSILDKPEPQWENAKKAAKEKFDRGDAYWQNVYHSIFTDANEVRWHRVVKFVKDYNAKNGTEYTVDQMLNAYVLAHPRTDLLAIGAITVEQVRRTAASLELAKKLGPADLEYLYSGK